MNGNFDYIRDSRQMEFAIFCIESTAKELGIDAEKMYDLLTDESDVLENYIIPNYEALHTQGKDYIAEDILHVLREKGVNI